VLALADARPESGLGHLARSSAVVTALRLHGVETHCLALGGETEIWFDGIAWVPDASAPARPDDVGAVLLDSYVQTETDHEALGPVACFFDGNRPAPSSAAQIVIAPAADPKPRSGWLSGLRYACLRPAFWGICGLEPAPAVTTVLVATGATDPDGISTRLLEATLEALPSASVRRIVGPGCEPSEQRGVADVNAPSDLRSELRRADLVVCLGGQTALEAACVGVPTLAVAINDNQDANVAHLAAAGAVEAAGLDGDLSACIRTLAGDAARRTLLGRSARQAIDGFGALRVAAEIESLLAPTRAS
jgi:spore coat polysaccharide biosynthesis predicted glycosyltransferase SpsG